MKRHVRIERKDRARAARVAEVGQIRAGGAGRIDVHHARAPVGVHVVLAVRRLDDDGVEAPRILAVGVEERAVVETHRAAADDEREVVRLQHGRRAGVPLLAERLAAEAAVGEQAHLRRDRQRRETPRIERAADGGRDRRADAGGERLLHRGRIDDRAAARGRA